jgi:hypothetical protein
MNTRLFALASAGAFVLSIATANAGAMSANDGPSGPSRSLPLHVAPTGPYPSPSPRAQNNFVPPVDLDGTLGLTFRPDPQFVVPDLTVTLPFPLQNPPRLGEFWGGGTSTFSPYGQSYDVPRDRARPPLFVPDKVDDSESRLPDHFGG